MSWLDGLRHRLYVTIRSGAYAREQAEERRVHGEMEAAHGGGASTDPPELARARPDPPRRAPGAAFLDPMRQDLAYAIRGIVRAPGFTAMVVATLALGVGANAAVFSLLDRVFGQPPSGLSDPASLRRLYLRLPQHPVEPGMVFPSFNYPSYSALKAAAAGAGELAAWTPSSERTIRDGDRDLDVRVSWVTYDFFSVLGVGAVRGRLFGPEEERIDVPAPVAVISHAVWEGAFGSDPAFVARPIELDGTSFTIVGVAARGFHGLDLSRVDVFLPLSTFPGQGIRPEDAWYASGGNYLRVAARLPGGGDERTLAAAATLGHQRQPYIPGYSTGTTAVVLAGSIVEARGPARRDQATSISVRMGGVTAIVWLIACANAAGLLLIHAKRRRRELAVRLALGLSRGRLVSQLLIEGIALAALAGAAALLLAVWGGAALRSSLLPAVQWPQPPLEARTVAFTLATAVAAGLLAALAPATLLRRVDVSTALRAGVREGVAPRSPARMVLIGVQSAFSVVLLVGAGLFVRSLGSVGALPLGYDVDELALASAPVGPPQPGQPEALAEIASRMDADPRVEGVALSSNAPMRGWSGRAVSLPGRDSLPQLRPGEFPSFLAVTPDFFAVTGMRIVSGRGFDVGDGEGVVIVNETMARTFWPGESALGQCMIVGGPDAPCSEVIGVASDARRSQVIEEPTLQYFVPLREADTPGAIVLRVDRSAWPAVAPLLEAELDRRFGARTMRVYHLREALEPQLRPWRLGARLFTAFGILALLVTLVGVYGVMAYAVSQRTHEMGVRIALGARLRDVLGLVVGEGLRVVALGALLGVGLALALGRLVEPLLHGVTPRDPVALAAAVAVLLVTGAAASFVPAWRAGRVDPVRALSAD